MNTRTAAHTGTDLHGKTQLGRESGLTLCESASEDRGVLSEAVTDRYRCPEKFFDFGLREPLSATAGYFQFGPDAICYGRACSGVQAPSPDSALWDAIRDVSIEDTKLLLPFDPNKIIDNLRLERYVQGRNTENNSRNAFRKLYYFLRPFTNLAMRRRVQKFHARNWKKETFPKWPVETGVEEICETLLLKSLQARDVERVPFVWFWPGGARAALMMTHDVETAAGRDHCADSMNLDDALGLKDAL